MKAAEQLQGSYNHGYHRLGLRRCRRRAPRDLRREHPSRHPTIISSFSVATSPSCWPVIRLVRMGQYQADRGELDNFALKMDGSARQSVQVPRRIRSEYSVLWLAEVTDVLTRFQLPRLYIADSRAISHVLNHPDIFQKPGMTTRALTTMLGPGTFLRPTHRTLERSHAFP